MSKEFDKFDAAMRKLIAIPHDKLKDALDKEKAEKAQRPRKKRVKSDR